jgi:hypothetical protein
LPEQRKQTAEDWQVQVDAELDEEIRRLVDRSTAVRGLSFHVRDQAVLARVAALVQSAHSKASARRAL